MLVSGCWFTHFHHGPGLWEVSRSLLFAGFIQPVTRSSSCWKTQLCPTFNHLAVDLKQRIWRQSSTSTSGSETAPEHDATTTMLDCWCKKPHLNSSKHSTSCGQKVGQSFSRRRVACPCGQLDGADSGGRCPSKTGFAVDADVPADSTSFSSELWCFHVVLAHPIYCSFI